MALSIALLLAFGAGFIIRALLESDRARVFSPEVEQTYGVSRYHSYD
jgi:hypothetical protein